MIQNLNKKGFGIIEVLAASVVLGFLIVGLTQLQKGNREAVLRIRARDAAQLVATDVIDSLKRLGLSSVEITPTEFEKERVFEGSGGSITSTVKYLVKVEVSRGEDDIYENTEQTSFTRNFNEDLLKYDYAKRVDISVEWEFKKSTQSIQISEVIK
ncbi:MAG: hypothetical protein FWH22_10455 [Fibromonadales bacterium]|nr:hypothetical protein [Fibromonadales bacterium]